MACIRRIGTQAIPVGAVTVVQLNDVEYADGITADVNNFRLVIELAGYYVLTANVGWQNVPAAGYRGAIVYAGPPPVSAIAVSDYRPAVNGGATIIPLTSKPVALQPGDEVNLRVFQTDSTARNVQDTNGALYLSAEWRRPL